MFIEIFIPNDQVTALFMKHFQIKSSKSTHVVKTEQERK